MRCSSLATRINAIIVFFLLRLAAGALGFFQHLIQHKRKKTSFPTFVGVGRDWSIPSWSCIYVSSRFPFFLSLSLPSLSDIIFSSSFFFSIYPRTRRERTNERKRVPTIEKYISTPGWQLGQYRWPRNCLSKKKKGKKTFSPLSFFLQHRYIYRGKKKKPPSALFQLRAHSWNCCCCCTTPWLFIPEPFPETSNDLKPHWYFLLLFFLFFYFSFLAPYVF